MKTLSLYVTNYRSGIFNKQIILELKELGNNNFETANGTVMHVFDSMPFMRDIKSNQHWFIKNIYHFKKTTL